MGDTATLFLVDQEGKIIDALKRVDEDMSSQRLVLPGLLYRSLRLRTNYVCSIVR